MTACPPPASHRHSRCTSVLFLALVLAVALSTGPRAVSPDVVISQVYGGGGNTGAPYTHDFVELFNRGTAPVSLAGWSVQYASATGTGSFSANPIVSLTGSLAPGQYYLIQLAGGANGVALPTSNATGTANMSGSAGKVALVNSTAGLACNGGSTPCSPAQLAQIVDLVGYGSANFFEGAPAPATTNTTAAIRQANGCTETDNNSTDFAAAAPTPRNLGSALNPCAGDAAPGVNTMVPGPGASGVGLDSNVTVTFTEPVTATAAAFTISCTISGIHSFALSGGPTAYTLDPLTNFVSNESCNVTVIAALVSDADVTDPPDVMTANVHATFTTVEACGDPATLISIIQGNGLTSPLAGLSVSIEGVVTVDLQDAFGGYFVQEEAADVDASAETSEGIFVFNSTFPVSVGDHVRVRGSVFEFGTAGATLTELTSVTGRLVCSTGLPLPAPVGVTLPVDSVDAWERHEGMLVSMAQELTVTETFNLGRFGEVALSVGGRLVNPTQVAAPGAPAAAIQALNDRRRILLDDGNNSQNIDPTRYPVGGLSADSTLRSGDTLTGLSGVLEQRFGEYRIQPVGTTAFVAANPRPLAPAPVGGTLKVASFNLLNYFNGNGVGGGFPTSRGATTLAEFERQRAKTIAAIVAMNADVVGLMELENDAPGASAIEDLVSGLNQSTAPGTWALIDTGVVGTDEIRVGLIYKPAAVTPFNAFAILDSSDDPRFIDTLNRPSLAQTFSQNSNGKRLTVVVNHLKSKGSDCNLVGDPDTGDGQGHCNQTRAAAAAALVDWLAADPTGASDPDVLIIGDMNSYAREDPITAIRNGGFTDLISAFGGDGGYSYVFDGQSGYLDHALASLLLAPRITGVTEWHINADEPTVLDYNVEFKSANHVNSLYAPSPFRSSDHDPVIIGINLIEPYDWTGFFSPIGTMNVVKSGRAIAVTFSLGGDRGLDVFASGYPLSQPVQCGGSALGEEVATGTPGASGLSYDALSDRYTYVWKTEAVWAGTCRQLVVKLADGTVHTAVFTFTR
jgi:predicted extracellular nuclease